jgi:hypothetical protein
MKSLSRTLCALCVFTLALSVPMFGQNASGNFTFSSPDGSYAINFTAHGQGLNVGEMTFEGPAPRTADEEAGGPGASNLSLKVSWDCLAVNLNGAIMTGSVTSANDPSYVGRLARLSVEEGSPARFSYAFFRNETINENPSDAEVPGDAGAMFSWIATDHERADDKGKAMSGRRHRENCQSMTASAAAVSDDMMTANGSITVRP